MKKRNLLLLVVLFLSACVQIPDLNPSQSSVVVSPAPYILCFDFISYSSTVEVDINQDGLVDFLFSTNIITCSGGPGSESTFINRIDGTVVQNGVTVNNQIASKIESSVLLLESAAAVGFSQNQVFEYNLSNGAFWRNQAICLFDSDPCTNDPYLYNIYPEFQAPSKYIVVKFKIANKFHYGWIELDSYCSGGLMAYNSEPGLRLRVGMID